MAHEPQQAPDAAADDEQWRQGHQSPHELEHECDKQHQQEGQPRAGVLARQQRQNARVQEFQRKPRQGDVQIGRDIGDRRNATESQKDLHLKPFCVSYDKEKSLFI